MTKHHRRTYVPIKTNDPYLKALFRYMDVNNITNGKAEDLSGVDRTVISNWRRGASTPRLDLFAAVCEAVGLVVSVVASSKKRDAAENQMELEL